MLALYSFKAGTSWIPLPSAVGQGAVQALQQTQKLSAGVRGGGLGVPRRPVISPWLGGLMGKEKQEVTHPIISSETKKTSLSFYRKTDALSEAGQWLSPDATTSRLSL